MIYKIHIFLNMPYFYTIYTIHPMYFKLRKTCSTYPYPSKLTNTYAILCTVSIQLPLSTIIHCISAECFLVSKQCLRPNGRGDLHSAQPSKIFHFHQSQSTSPTQVLVIDTRMRRTLTSFIRGVEVTQRKRKKWFVVSTVVISVYTSMYMFFGGMCCRKWLSLLTLLLSILQTYCVDKFCYAYISLYCLNCCCY